MASAGNGIPASRRRIRNTITASTRYTTDRVPYPTGMLPAPVTACETRITSYTIHGCRPTSVVIHPAISATTDSGPAATTAHSTSRGRPRSRNRRYRYTRPSSASSVPIPTMAWKEKRTTLTGGWSASGTMFSPLTVALGL